MQVTNARRWLVTFKRFGFQFSIHRCSVSPWHLFEMFVYGGVVMYGLSVVTGQCGHIPIPRLASWRRTFWQSQCESLGDTCTCTCTSIQFLSHQTYFAIQFIHSFVRSFILYFKLNFWAIRKSNTATASEEVVSSGRDSQ
jgi:hypothetical protein